MKITIKNNMSATDKLAIEHTMELLKNIQHSFDEGAILSSTTTGESFTIDELPRVLGILSGLSENDEWVMY